MSLPWLQFNCFPYCLLDRTAPPIWGRCKFSFLPRSNNFCFGPSSLGGVVTTAGRSHSLSSISSKITLAPCSAISAPRDQRGPGGHKRRQFWLAPCPRFVKHCFRMRPHRFDLDAPVGGNFRQMPTVCDSHRNVHLGRREPEQIAQHIGRRGPAAFGIERHQKQTTAPRRRRPGGTVGPGEGGPPLDPGAVRQQIVFLFGVRSIEVMPRALKLVSVLVPSGLLTTTLKLAQSTSPESRAVPGHIEA